MGLEELIGWDRIFEGLLFLVLYGASLGAAALGIFLVIIGIKYDAGVPVVVGLLSFSLTGSSGTIGRTARPLTSGHPSYHCGRLLYGAHQLPL